MEKRKANTDVTYCTNKNANSKTYVKEIQNIMILIQNYCIGLVNLMNQNVKNVIVIHLKKSDMEKASIKNFINQRKGNKMNEKEFEELFGNTPFENIKKIQHYIDKNYIPVQIIEDFIKNTKN